LLPFEALKRLFANFFVVLGLRFIESKMEKKLQLGTKKLVLQHLSVLGFNQFQTNLAGHY